MKASFMYLGSLLDANPSGMEVVVNGNSGYKKSLSVSQSIQYPEVTSLQYSVKDHALTQKSGRLGIPRS
jgi:hypothetical protein